MVRSFGYLHCLLYIFPAYLQCYTVQYQNCSAIFHLKNVFDITKNSRGGFSKMADTGNMEIPKSSSSTTYTMTLGLQMC